MKLSILIPVYNEEKTILELISKIKKVNLKKIKKEIIIIDDNSTDKTSLMLKKINNRNIKILKNSENRGKGYSIRRAIKEASGDVIIFQDADLEYNPQDYNKMLNVFLDNKDKVIYGSRFLNGKIKGNILFFMGNKILSYLTSLLYLSKITDMETCYKMFPAQLIKKINLNSDRFAIEPEITAKLLKSGYKIIEVPIDYAPRSIKQGKKIRIKDGLSALKALLYYRIFE